MSELKELTGLEENKKYQEDIANQTLLFRAYRSYYVAKANTLARRWREALIVYKSSLKLIQTIVSSKAAQELKDKALKLRKDIQSEVYVAQAHCVIEDTDEKPLSDFPTKNAAKVKTPLIERLEEYREDTGVITRNARIVDMPTMEPVPNKPLFFDLASNFVQFPDLSDKLETAQKPKASTGMSGFVKGLFGWGGK